MSEPKIAAAAGIAVKSINPKNKERAQEAEKAMSQAILNCMSKGITDPAAQRAEIMKAREKALSSK